MQSWKKYCPDYEIIEWNESNFDVSMNQYVKEAYDNKKWAFVSDVARIWCVYHYGGIYLDTDVELSRSIDDFLEYEMFAFFETLYINTGMGFGAEKGNPILQAILEDYNARSFVKSNGNLDLSPCPGSNSMVIANCLKDLRLDGTEQQIGNIKFFTYGAYAKYMHHYGTASWGDKPNYSKERRVYKDTALKRFLRKESRMEFVRKKLGKRIFTIYVFISYDLLEYGLLHYVKRCKQKITNRFSKK